MLRTKCRENAQGMQRVNYIKESEEEEEHFEKDEKQLVLRVNGKDSKPFYMEGMICGTYFEAIIDTGSPVSSFTMSDLQKIVDNLNVVTRNMIGDERYVDYN